MPGTRYINNVTGNDSTGDGLSIGTAYATIARGVQDVIDTSFVLLICDTGTDYVEDATTLPWPRCSYQGVSSAGLPDIESLPRIRFDGSAVRVFENNGYIKSIWIDGESQINGLHAQWGGLNDVQFCRISNMASGSSSFNRTTRPTRAIYSCFDNNAGPGAFFSGGGAHGCVAYNNGQDGLNGGAFVFSNCVALENGNDGISMWGNSTIGSWVNCVSMYNTWSGFRMNHGAAAQADRCISAYNGQYGFNCQNGTGNGYITDSIAYQNTSGALRDNIPTNRSGPIASAIYFGPSGTASQQFTAVHNLSVSDPEITLGASPPFELDMPTTSPAYQSVAMPAAIAPFLSIPHAAAALSIGATGFEVFPSGGGGGGSPVTRSWWG